MYFVEDTFTEHGLFSLDSHCMGVHNLLLITKILYYSAATNYILKKKKNLEL